MRERLLPLATIATPNLPEARILAELPEGSADQCAEKLLSFVKHLLITGGHGDEHEVHNRLYSRDGLRKTYTCQRLPGSYHAPAAPWPAHWPAAWPKVNTWPVR